jgi:glutamyl-tRNA reductase
MISYLIGIDYKTVPRNIREETYRLRRGIIEYWEKINPGKTAVLSTCNRIEIYAAADSYEKAIVQVEAFQELFKRQFKNAYVYYGEEVVRHGLRLACGLESQLKGEYQILRQLEAWSDDEDFPVSFSEIWKHILTEAKGIRARTGLGKDVVDVASILYDELQKDVSFKGNAEVLIIGTGKIAELLAYKKPHWAHLCFVARKKLSKAKRLVDLAGGEALLPADMPARLITADAVISATSSPHYTLTLRHFNKALLRRKNKLYIYDVAMPSDVAPDIKKIQFVKLRNLDYLTLNFSKKNYYIAENINLAARLIEKKVFEYKESIYVQKNKTWNKAQSACAQAG